MNDVLLLLGRLAGAIGVAVCALALIVRVGGSYTLAGFELGTLFLGGIAAMVAACLCLLLRISGRP